MEPRSGERIFRRYAAKTDCAKYVNALQGGTWRAAPSPRLYFRPPTWWINNTKFPEHTRQIIDLPSGGQLA